MSKTTNLVPSERDREMARVCLMDMGDATEDQLSDEIAITIAQARSEGAAENEESKRPGVEALILTVSRQGERILELEAVMRRVEQWWVSGGYLPFDVAPECIFALRSALAQKGGQ